VTKERQQHDNANALRRVRLIRKLALSLNGVDLSTAIIGQILLLPEPHAAMLIAEGWAEPVSKSPTITRGRRTVIPPEQH